MMATDLAHNLRIPNASPAFAPVEDMVSNDKPMNHLFSLDISVWTMEGADDTLPVVL